MTSPERTEDFLQLNSSAQPASAVNAADSQLQSAALAYVLRTCDSFTGIGDADSRRANWPLYKSYLQVTADLYGLVLNDVLRYRLARHLLDGPANLAVFHQPHSCTTWPELDRFLSNNYNPLDDTMVSGGSPAGRH